MGELSKILLGGKGTKLFAGGGGGGGGGTHGNSIRMKNGFLRNFLRHGIFSRKL